MKSFDLNPASIIRAAGKNPLAFSAFTSLLVSIIAVYLFSDESFWARVIISIIIFIFVSCFSLFVLRKFGSSSISSESLNSSLVASDHAPEIPFTTNEDKEIEKSDKKNTLYCSFCGKSQHEVRKLIAGPTVFICDECTDLCFEITTEVSDKTEKINKICELTVEASNIGLGIHQRQEIIEEARDIADSIRQRRRESPGDMRAGCRLHRVIGTGNFGTVWQAYQLQKQEIKDGNTSNDKIEERDELNEIVAVKKFDEDKISVGLMLWRFLRGIRAMEHLSNVLLNPPNSIIRLIDVDLDYICFSMQYCPNGDLENISHYGWATNKKINIYSQICEAVNYAHSHNVVHRDIKPANIVLDDNYNAVLTDFDIADLMFAKTQSVYASSLGTPQFAAPEQLIGDNLMAYPTADVYSLGKLLFFLMREVAAPLGSTDGDRLPGYIEEMEERSIRHIIARAIQYKPEKRYQSALELLNELKETINVQ